MVLKTLVYNQSNEELIRIGNWKSKFNLEVTFYYSFIYYYSFIILRRLKNISIIIILLLTTQYE